MRIDWIQWPHRAFTWSNNQTNRIMAKQDRMLATVDWDLKYPIVGLIVLPKGVSDHSHVQIQFGGKPERKYPIFCFEKWWLDMEDFAEVVQKAWDIECP
jgi:hypothetical protein